MAVMTRQRTSLMVVGCLLIAVSAGQTPSRMPSRGAVPNRGTNTERTGEVIRQWREQREEMEWKKSQMAHARLKAAMMATIKQLLKADERQWRLIEPRYDKIQELRSEAGVHAVGWGAIGRHREGLPWGRRRWWGSGRLMRRDEMTEGQIAVEELIDVMIDENADDAQIREKIDAVQQAREKARKQLPEARRELHKVLNGPRQEVAMVVMRVLD